MFEKVAGAWGRNRIYPEREERRPGKTDGWFDGFQALLAARFRPSHGAYGWVIDAVKTNRTSLRQMTDAQVLDAGRALRPVLSKEGFTKDLVGRAFALVQEVAERHLGISHFDVQLIGGYVLLNGMVAEMETGEGKTLMATLPACTLALAGIPVHIITVNDYLTARDAQWMGPVYEALGLTVDTIVHGKEPPARCAAYRCDITYCTNKEVAFDYLRDRLVLWDRPSQLRLTVEQLYGESSRIPKLVMRGLHFAIVDEADSVLIDEARTPLIISSLADGRYGENVYRLAMEMATSFASDRDFSISKGDRHVALTPSGQAKVKGADWSAASSNINEKQKEQLVKQSLSALYLFKLDQQYLVKDGKVQIIDEYTGRLMADRSWEMGIHQLIEIKEGCEVTLPKQTMARISYQRFFRRYLGIAGMTGTAREVAGELWSVYRMRAVAIKPNRPVKRVHHPDRVYAGAAEKYKAIVANIADLHETGRPVLVGTRSVEASEHLSRLLNEKHLPHKVLNARQDEEEAEIIAKAGDRGRITVATNMAGRGTDIRLGEGVGDLGGLHVIATERHESGRIDRQLFGRCGRQGDPGSCIAMIALDDELITVHTSRLTQWIGALLIHKPDGRLSRGVGRIVFKISQKSAERLHSRMRRNLLKMDDRVGDALAFSGRAE